MRNDDDARRLGFCIQPVHNKVISGFKALRQAGAPMAGLEPAPKGSLQISGRTHKPPLSADVNTSIGPTVQARQQSQAK
ncbi:hypothetical protein PoB_006023400 [Plakobranchus ocellatus]|uniref:Uncharacterized protein n=1 Tax=Plakobranchus ocellatus TaxID=259542 RepID=A0AAV4CPF3_9GAST|nr:hypothetical protein PoB_006023400 [Plakobranchus ocellatus]